MLFVLYNTCFSVRLTMGKYTVVQFEVDGSVAVIATKWLHTMAPSCASILVASVATPENLYSGDHTVYKVTCTAPVIIGNWLPSKCVLLIDY